LNAEDHGVAERIFFKRGDLWQPFEGEDIRFDVIVSNPPYVDSRVFLSLPCEVRDHEPRAALDGKEGGMFYIEKIIWGSKNYLNPGAWLLIEMDPDQTPRALQWVEKSGFYGAWERVKDYSQRYRVVMAQNKDRLS
jgi:release factor glutamine methyltransferase